MTTHHDNPARAISVASDQGRGMRMHRILLVVATVALMVMSSSSALADSSTTIYDSLKLAPNLSSNGAEATQTREFGDRVTFAAGTSRALGRVTVSLSSWGCQTGHWYNADCQTALGAVFTVPITINIYAAGAGDSVGSMIVTQTRTFAVPYRPSSDNVRCTDGRWYAGASQGCFNGLQWLVSFDFGPQHITLPPTVVYGISYNTSHYGPSPRGEATACYSSSAGCPYDSLNVGLAPKVNTGSKPFPGTVYMNTSAAGNYCDGGDAGVNSFRLDSPTKACWAGYVPSVRFTASSANRE
jgi:hypothetical protein